MEYLSRRRRLLPELHHPLLLFSGGEIARNTPSHSYPFRADSNFLYLFGPCEPNCAAFFDTDEARVTFFAPQRTPQSALWTGPRPSFAQMKEVLQVEEVLDMEGLEAHLVRLRRGRPLHSLAVADRGALERARRLSGEALSFEEPGQLGAPELLLALARMRLCKEPAEVEEVACAAHITHEAHVEAMRHTRPGLLEQEVYARLLAAFARHGCTEAYASIVSVRGEVLHNPSRLGRLQAGDLLLVDAGAERPSGYGADVTRTWPVSGTFSPKARALYEVVLSANERCIAAIKPGLSFRSLQRLACEVLAEGLLELGLLRGRLEDILEAGALGVFFPHGVGHLLGLDTHDLSTFGRELLAKVSGEEKKKEEKEKEEEKKEKKKEKKEKEEEKKEKEEEKKEKEEEKEETLRADMLLKAGLLLTVEPGLYFIPGRIYSEEFRRSLGEFVCFEEAERYLEMNGGRGFGGIRIEDNVLCTQGEALVLTSMFPKQLEEVEALVGTA